jgi:hypothetical protein
LVSRSVVRTLAKTVSMIRLTQKLGRVEHGGLFTLATEGSSRWRRRVENAALLDPLPRNAEIGRQAEPDRDDPCSQLGST